MHLCLKGDYLRENEEKPMMAELLEIGNRTLRNPVLRFGYHRAGQGCSPA
jgi:hypothetical protein